MSEADVIQVTQAECAMAPGSTHHLVPRQGLMVCTYCERSSPELFKELLQERTRRWTCQQCGIVDRYGSTHEDHGYLCLRCAYRQGKHDDRRDGVED